MNNTDILGARAPEERSARVGANAAEPRQQKDTPPELVVASVISAEERAVDHTLCISLHGKTWSVDRVPRVYVGERLYCLASPHGNELFVQREGWKSGYWIPPSEIIARALLEESRRANGKPSLTRSAAGRLAAMASGPGASAGEVPAPHTSAAPQSPGAARQDTGASGCRHCSQAEAGPTTHSAGHSGSESGGLVDAGSWLALLELVSEMQSILVGAAGQHQMQGRDLFGAPL